MLYNYSVTEKDQFKKNPNIAMTFIFMMSVCKLLASSVYTGCPKSLYIGENGALFTKHPLNYCYFFKNARKELLLLFMINSG